MVVYPLSVNEDLAIRWAARTVPLVAMAVVLFMMAVTAVAAQG